MAQDMVDQAIAWHLRLATATAEEWHAFVVWLEADARHQLVYDRIVLDDALLSPSLDLDEPVAANEDDAPVGRRWARWGFAGGGALAASLAALLLLPQMGSQTYSIETAAGMSRQVMLDDGTSIEMNGGTKLTLNHGDNRYAMLDSGEATFHVRHDADHPFELTSGGFAVRDLGTVFNVTREGPRLAVQVAEGAVLFQPDRQAVTLKPGMALAIYDGEDKAAVSNIPATDVGGWRHGMLTFRNTPLSSVALAVRRSTGVQLTLGRGLSDRVFTGTIHVSEKADIMVPRVAALLDTDWRREGTAWTLTPRSNETP